MKRMLLFGLLFSLLLAACSSAAPQVTPTAASTSAAPTALEGTRWVLESMGAAGQESSLLPGSIVTLRFEANAQAAGNGGCNSFGGTYETRENSITFLNLVSTLMACADNAVTQQEAEYLRALNTAVSYELTAGSLTITYDSGLLHFVPVE